MDSPQDIRDANKKLQDEYEQRVADKNVDIVMDRKRPDIKVPVKVAIRKQVQVSDLPAVWLFAFGNLTVEEYNQYLKDNAQALTINEMTASKVLEGVMKGNREDVSIYWRLQEKLISKPQVVQGKSSLADLRPNAIMSKLLDEIEANVFGKAEAMEGEVIADDDLHQTGADGNLEKDSQAKPI